MALKIALFAALCVAQAFAFQPSFLNFGSEDGRDQNLDIVAGCFGDEKAEFAAIGNRLPEVRKIVFDSLKQEEKEMAEKYFKALDEPLANFAALMNELHENVYNLLKEYRVPDAVDAAVAAAQKTEEIFGVMAQELQKGIDELPEFENTSEWLLRYMRFSIDLAKRYFRESFGKCLQQ